MFLHKVTRKKKKKNPRDVAEKTNGEESRSDFGGVLGRKRKSNDDFIGRSKELERKKKKWEIASRRRRRRRRCERPGGTTATKQTTLRLDDDDYGMMQLKEPRGDGDGSFEEDDIATDSELDEELNREEALRNSSLLTGDKKRNDDANANAKDANEDAKKDDDADEIQSTKTKTISTRELILKRKENVEELMRLYEQTYYDLIETMRKRHRKFQLKTATPG